MRFEQTQDAALFHARQPFEVQGRRRGKGEPFPMIHDQERGFKRAINKLSRRWLVGLVSFR